MSTATEKQLQLLDKQLSLINDNLIKIEHADPCEHEGLCAAMNVQKNKLLRRQAALTKLRQELVQIRTNESINFNTAQRAIVTDIKVAFAGRYDAQMKLLQQKDKKIKKEFFDAYEAADSDFLKESYLKSFFQKNH